MSLEVISKEMRAVGFDAPGGPDVLSAIRAPIPVPRDDEVLIRVHAAGVNRPDALQRAGKYPPPPGASPLLGLEVSGEVVQLGAEAEPLLLGQNVCALANGGGYAEYVAVPAGQCLPVPDGYDMTEAAALPETLLESELFGHEKGAFTGAVASKPGLFEVADGGTLFIDEIGELAGGLQAKLLRVLEDGSLRRVGSVKERRVSVRLLAATNRDLGEEIQKGRFREDLYYRINVLTIVMPPLRDRQIDILPLVRHFAGRDWELDKEFQHVIENYGWPGNIRQLRNAVERAKILADENRLLAVNLPPEIMRTGLEAASQRPGPESDLETLNRHHIADTFKRYQGNKARTARALGISRRTLYRLLEKHDIDS